MKTLFIASMLFASSAMAASMSGYIMDKACSEKAAMQGNEACAKRCIKNGQPAVFVSDGKVYNIDAASKDKAVEHAGQKVKVDGKVEGDTITITTITAESGS